MLKDKPKTKTLNSSCIYLCIGSQVGIIIIIRACRSVIQMNNLIPHYLSNSILIFLSDVKKMSKFEAILIDLSSDLYKLQHNYLIYCIVIGSIFSMIYHFVLIIGLFDNSSVLILGWLIFEGIIGSVSIGSPHSIKTIHTETLKF